MKLQSPVAVFGSGVAGLLAFNDDQSTAMASLMNQPEVNQSVVNKPMPSSAVGK